MSAVTVDASVWVAAADASDPHCDVSRAFFAEVTHRELRLVVPSIALVEVGCALARRSRDTLHARRLTQAMLAPDLVNHVSVDGAVVARAFDVGTERFLRGADALYVAAAAGTESILVSWDGEHLARGEGVSPDAWLEG
ncbi:MAG: PIN domain-containing protein [Thermoleophilia bacterium]